MHNSITGTHSSGQNTRLGQTMHPYQMAHTHNIGTNEADLRIINGTMCAAVTRSETSPSEDSVARKAISASHRSVHNLTAIRLETKVPNHWATSHPCCRTTVHSPGFPLHPLFVYLRQR